MDRPLLPGLLILLCCFRVLSGSFSDSNYAKIIQCRMCHLQFPGEKCSRGRGVCTAMVDEVCSTGRIFKSDGTLWLTFRGCLRNCANVDNIKWGNYLLNLRCCRAYDLCNEVANI